MPGIFNPVARGRQSAAEWFTAAAPIHGYLTHAATQTCGTPTQAFCDPLRNKTPSRLESNSSRIPTAPLRE